MVHVSTALGSVMGVGIVQISQTKQAAVRFETLLLRSVLSVFPHGFLMCFCRYGVG